MGSASLATEPGYTEGGKDNAVPPPQKGEKIMSRRNPGVRVPDSWRDLTMRAFAESEVYRGSKDEGPEVVVSLPMDDLRPAYGKLMGNIPKGTTMKLTIQTLASQPWVQGQQQGQGPNVGVTLLSYFQTSTIKGHIPSKKDVFLWRKTGGLRPKERFSIEEVLPGAVEHELGHFIQWWLSPGTPSGRKFGRVRQAARVRDGTGTGPTGDPSPGTSDWEYHAYLLSMGRIIAGILRSENKSMDEAIAIADNYYPNHIASFSPSRLAAFRRDTRRVVGRMLEAPKDESIGWVKAQAEVKIKKRRSRKGKRGGRARRNMTPREMKRHGLLKRDERQLKTTMGLLGGLGEEEDSPSPSHSSIYLWYIGLWWEENEEIDEYLERQAGYKRAFVAKGEANSPEEALYYMKEAVKEHFAYPRPSIRFVFKEFVPEREFGEEKDEDYAHLAPLAGMQKAMNRDLLRELVGYRTDVIGAVNLFVRDKNHVVYGEASIIKRVPLQSWWGETAIANRKR